MSKQIVSVEMFVCDACGQTDRYMTACLGCGKHRCFECKKTNGVEYTYAVHHGGSADGYFCKTCDASPPQKVLPLLEAYREVATLRREAERFYADFDARRKVAEDRLKALVRP